MALPFLKPSRCVLLIGDEALYVYNVTYSRVRLVDTVPWQAEDFEDTVNSLIKKECGGKPVLVLNDMTDQHFKGGQRIPKVGVMDKAGVIRRKLQVAFPNYPIRGALPIRFGKDFTSPSAPGGRQMPSGPVYLFAAVPMSEAVRKTLQAVSGSMASVAGFCLLPVESSDMVQSLAEKLSGRQKGKKGARWVLFVGQHQNGDLRQVVTRDGQLAMTRMTSVADIDSDPAVWAREVHHEIKATIGYLSRFGYTPQDGTDLIVIAGGQAGEELGKAVDFECNYHSFTAPEAARILGIGIGMQEDPRHANALHVAWAGRKTRFILPMQATEIEKIHRPRQYVAALTFLMALGALYAAVDLLGQSKALMDARGGIASQKRVLAQAETEYQQQVETMKAMGVDVRLVQGAIKLFDELDRRRIGILPVVLRVGEALGNELHLTSLSVDRTEKGNASADQFGGGGAAAAGTSSEFAVRLNMVFPPTIDPAYGIREVNDLERRLKTLLPEYRVRVEKQVASPEYTAATTGIAGKSAGGTQESYPAELSIRGPVTQ